MIFIELDGLFDYLKAEVYQELTLVPEMTWKASTIPDAPTNLRLEQVDGQSFFSLLWDQTNGSDRTIIYIVDPSDDPSTFKSDANRRAMTYDSNFDLSTIDIPQGHSVIITSFNRFGKEGTASNLFEVPAPVQGNLILPINSAVNVKSADSLIWSSIPLATNYILELATNGMFTEGLQQLVVSDTLIKIDQIILQGETTYFWRISGENFGGAGVFSEIFSFTTGFPKDVVVTNPEQNATSVLLSPVIQWNASAASDSIQIQLSEGGNAFNANNLFEEVFIENNSEGIYSFTKQLKTLTTYYLRMRSYNDFGYSAWTDVTQFRTLFPAPPAPVISVPEQGAKLAAEEVLIAWASAPTATSYLLQVALDADFAAPVLDERVFDGLDYTFTANVKDSTYYIRVSGRNPGGFGEWSELRSFSLINETVTSVTEANEQQITAFPNPVNETLTIKTTQDITPTDIAMYDARGARLQAKPVKVSSNEYQIDLAAQQCAPCLLRVKTGHHYQTIKVVSER